MEKDKLMYELLGNIAFYSPLSKKYPEKLLILLIFSRFKYRESCFFLPLENRIGPKGLEIHINHYESTKRGKMHLAPSLLISYHE